MLRFIPRYKMIALASASLTLGTFYQHTLKLDLIPILFNALGVYLVYNRYQVVEKKHPTLLKISYWILFLMTVVLGYFYIKTITSWISISLIGTAGLFYTKKLKLLRNSLRDIQGLKLLLVVSCWFYIICIFPIFNSTSSIDVKLADIITLIQIGIVGLAFDLRDIEIDPPTRKTIPQIIGEKYTTWVCMGLSIFSFILVEKNTLGNLLLYLTAIGIQLVLISQTKTHQKSWFGSLLEFSLVVWGIGMCL
jgi:hypothetical protein